MTPITLVAAHARRRVIGLRQRLPWHLPEDLRHFRTLTWGASILMGRRTFDAIGKALPGRRNLVLSHSANWQAPEVSVVHSLEQAIGLVGDLGLYVVGGAQVYALALPLACRAVVTEIDLEVEGDAYFPELDAGQWTLRHTQCAVGSQGLHYRVVEYHRVRNAPDLLRQGICTSPTAAQAVARYQP